MCDRLFGPRKREFPAGPRADYAETRVSTDVLGQWLYGIQIVVIGAKMFDHEKGGPASVAAAQEIWLPVPLVRSGNVVSSRRFTDTQGAERTPERPQR